MRDPCTVTAHRIRTAIEDAGFGRVKVVDGPVPVGLRALVAAFIAEGVFI